MSFFSHKVPPVKPGVDQLTLNRCIGLLLEGIRLHVCDEDSPLAAAFSRKMRQLDTQFPLAQNDAERLAIIAAAIESMRLCHAENAYLVAQAREQSNLLSRLLVAQLAECLSGSRPEAADALLSHAAAVETTSGAEPVKILREKLERLLTADELKSEEPTAQAKIDLSEEELEAITGDGPTGLRGRAKAKQTLAGACTEGSCYAVLFRLESRDTVEQQYGADAAQDCLIAVSSYVLQALEGDYQLFHWDTDALLAVYRSTQPLQEVTRDMRLISAARPQQSIRIGDRFVMAGVSIHESVFPIAETANCEDLVRQIDDSVRQSAMNR